MSDGLITRIGKWIDRVWEAKVTEKDLALHDAECRGRYVDFSRQVSDLRGRIGSVADPTKEVAELRERLGHLEVYVGMKRVVDPAKPAVAKSAFAM